MQELLVFGILLIAYIKDSIMELLVETIHISQLLLR